MTDGSNEKKTGLRKGLATYGDAEFSLFMRRVFIKAMGYTDDALDRPIIGITDTYSDFNPCHGNVPDLIEAAKRLQALTEGLVVLVHHTGKNASAGLRGHSSLIAALDAAIEVSREGDSRQWSVAKAKDGADGNCERFKLKIEMVGLDSDGDAITSCFVEKDDSVVSIQKVTMPQGTNQKLVMAALRPMFKSGVTGKAGAPPLAKCIELEIAIAAGGIKLTCPTDKRTTRSREAITGLTAKGILGLNDGWL